MAALGWPFFMGERLKKCVKNLWKTGGINVKNKREMWKTEFFGSEFFTSIFGC